MIQDQMEITITPENKVAKDIRVLYKGKPIACTLLKIGVYYAKKSDSEWVKQSRKMLRDMGEIK